MSKCQSSNVEALERPRTQDLIWSAGMNKFGSTGWGSADDPIDHVSRAPSCFWRLWQVEEQDGSENIYALGGGWLHIEAFSIETKLGAREAWVISAEKKRDKSARRLRCRSKPCRAIIQNAVVLWSGKAPQSGRKTEFNIVELLSGARWPGIQENRRRWVRKTGKGQVLLYQTYGPSVSARSYQQPDNQYILFKGEVVVINGFG